MTLQCAVLGGGVMGVLHAKAFARLPDVHLVGVVELDRARQDALVDMGCPVLSDTAELPDVDAVSVCLPDDIRMSVLEQFLDAGTALLIEKPFATSVAECREIMSRANDNQIMVGQLMRFDPRIAALRSSVAAGSLGDLWTGRIWRCSNTATAARIAPRTSVAWFLGIHDVDIIRHVTGQAVTAVRATGHSVVSDTYDVVRGQLVLECGAAIGFDWSWVWPDNLPTGMTAGLELVGPDGAAVCELGHNTVHVVDQRTGRHRVPDMFHWPQGHGGVQTGDIRDEVAAFVDAVRTNKEMPVSAGDATESVAVIETVHRACDKDGALTPVSY